MPVFRCAICEREVHFGRREDAPWRPFCSERCKMVDLGRWLDGSYQISEPLPSAEPLVGRDEDEAGDE